MARDHVVQARFSDSEYQVIEKITDEMGCSDAEALRKCARIVGVYNDEKVHEMIQSEEFEAVSRIMSK